MRGQVKCFKQTQCFSAIEHILKETFYSDSSLTAGIISTDSSVGGLTDDVGLHLADA